MNALLYPERVNDSHLDVPAIEDDLNGMIDQPTLAISEHDGYVIVTLNRPASRNPLSESMLDALKASFASLAPRRDIRAILLNANAPADAFGGFKAGHLITTGSLTVPLVVSHASTIKAEIDGIGVVECVLVA